jgi:hypothetical protein
MAEYYIGNRLVNDDGEPNEGIPVIDADGQEIYVLPEEFDYLGRPESDLFRWQPGAFDKKFSQQPLSVPETEGHNG